MSEYIAHWWRYRQHHTRAFDTLEEAKDFLEQGESMGELSTEIIETPAGVVEGDTLAPIFGKRTPGCQEKKK